MDFRWMAAACAAMLVGGASAQDAVQWRVEDGGNGHWYRIKVVAQPLTWSSASNDAATVGAHLASILSSQENGFVLDLSFSTPGAVRNAGGTVVGPWIGARRDQSTGVFHWSSGEPWNFTAWCGGEPTGAIWEDAICYYSGNVCWNDRPGDYVGSTACLSAVFEWSADCNNDGLVDYGQILTGQLADTNANGIPDTCELDPCPGDITGNGSVNGLDLAAVLADWGSGGKSEYDCDVDNDGVVGGSDLSIVLAGWGACP